MIPFHCSNSELVYNGYFRVRKDKLHKPSGEVAEYTFLDMPWSAAVVLAETPQKKLLINREYRHPTKMHILCCPGGGLHDNEDPILGGLRELFEETGYTSDEPILLGKAFVCPSICNQVIYYIYAKNAYLKAPKTLDPFEHIETELKTEEELHREILMGSLVDGILCTALWYKSRVSR